MMEKTHTNPSIYLISRTLFPVIKPIIIGVFPALVLIAIFLVGFQARISSLPTWERWQQETFYDGEPLLTTTDGYYYLRLAYDLKENLYNPIDEKRGVPNSPSRPSPAPLSAHLASIVSHITGISLNWVGAFLPALLGGLIIIPAYFWGKAYNGIFMGLSCAALCSLANSYVTRSGFGWFDTDFLNVTLCLSVCLCFYLFAQEDNNRRRYVFFTMGVIASGAFYWWWDQNSFVVITLCVIPLITAVVFRFFYRDYAALLILLIIIVFFVVISFVGERNYLKAIIHHVLQTFFYIAKHTNNAYPNIGISISEQVLPSFQDIISGTTGNIHIFIIAMSGLLGLLIKSRWHFMFLLVPTILGGLAFFYAERFIIYLVPPIAFGMSFFLSEFWKSSKPYLHYLAPILLVLTITTYYFTATYRYPRFPTIHHNSVHSLTNIRRITPEDAIVWAPWSNGYHIQYFSQRSTFGDGELHSGERSYYEFLPFATNNSRFAANFMRFYAVQGLRGIQLFRRQNIDQNIDQVNQTVKDILSTGSEHGLNVITKLLVNGIVSESERTAEDWLKFFYPIPDKPVYLFLQEKMFASAHWWFWFANWSTVMQESVHPFQQIYTGIRIDNNRLWSRWNMGSSISLDVDLLNGVLQDNRHKEQLQEILIKNESDYEQINYENGTKILHVDMEKEKAYLLDRKLWESTFCKLVLETHNTMPGFKLVFNDVDSNSYLWKITGE